MDHRSNFYVVSSQSMNVTRLPCVGGTVVPGKDRLLISQPEVCVVV